MVDSAAGCHQQIWLRVTEFVRSLQQVLPARQEYTFGVRALVSIARLAGHLRRLWLASHQTLAFSARSLLHRQPSRLSRQGGKASTMVPEAIEKQCVMEAVSMLVLSQVHPADRPCVYHIVRVCTALSVSPGPCSPATHRHPHGINRCPSQTHMCISCGAPVARHNPMRLRWTSLGMVDRCMLCCCCASHWYP